MSTNEMQSIVQAADHVARQGDRWLFIATLIIFGVFALSVGRYFLKQHSNLISDHNQARQMYQESLRIMVNEQHEITKQLAVVMDRNTAALNENSRQLQLNTRRA